MVTTHFWQGTTVPLKVFLVIDRSFLLSDNELDIFLRLFLIEGPAVVFMVSNQELL